MMSDREDDFERGVRNRRTVLGDAWVDRALGGADAFNAEFQELITRHASAPARAQLERLARHAALQRDGAPWDAWRPDEGADEDDKETE